MLQSIPLSLEKSLHFLASGFKIDKGIKCTVFKKQELTSLPKHVRLVHNLKKMMVSLHDLIVYHLSSGLHRFSLNVFAVTMTLLLRQEVNICRGLLGIQPESIFCLSGLQKGCHAPLLKGTSDNFGTPK